MNAKVWAGTKSNPLFVHAFPEGKGICNARISPRAGHDLMTLEEARQIQLKVCERCEFRMAHLARKAEAEANPIQTLTPAQALEIANSEGHVLEFGSAKEYKRPQGFPKIVRFVPESNGRMVALVDTDGKTYKRVRADHKFFVRSVPEGYASRVAQAQAEALADLDSDTDAVTLVEVAAPVAQAERRTVDAPQLDAQADAEAVSAQDMADAALASGECTWTDEQIEDAERREREAARARLDVLRSEEETAVETVFVGTHKNIQHMISFAPNEKARASWARVAARSGMRDMMRETVKAHARANYERGGWDVIVEAWTNSEINEYLDSMECGSVAQALDAFRTLVSVWREREAGAIIDAHGF